MSNNEALQGVLNGYRMPKVNRILNFHNLIELFSQMIVMSCIIK
jgi:hypothetical protein